jgi:type III secretion protein V
VVTPWSLHVGEQLQVLIEDERRGDVVVRAGLRSRVMDVRESIFAELGAPLPPAPVRITEQLPAYRAVLSVFEVPFRIMDVPEDKEPEEQLELVERFMTNGMRERASEFVGIAETQMLLDQLEQVSPPLPRQLVPKPISLAQLTDILRRLVEEGVSIRDLRGVLEALATAPPTEKDTLSLAELVRTHLRRATTFQLTSGAPALSVYLLDPEVEETVRGAVQRTPSGSFLALSPRTTRDILNSIRQAMEQAPPADDQPTVLLTQPDIRRFLRKLVEVQWPEMRVISYAELLPEISLRPLGRVSLSGMGE